MRLRFLSSWLLAACILTVACGAQVSVTTHHNDNARTGQNTQETILTPANVNSTQFGKVFTYRVDGNVYAQPLVLTNITIPGKGVHNVLYIATEHDSVYAWDADHNRGINSMPLWKVSFLNAAQNITVVPSDDISCSDLVPEVGITGTPVIDAASGTMYLVAKTRERGRYTQKLHALDVATGAEKFGGPVTIEASVAGSGAGSSNGMVRFDPFRQAQRPGLLLQNGAVYIGWASHCDIGPYHGWVMTYGAQSLQQTGVWLSTPNGDLGGVWAAGEGLPGDGLGNVYPTTGNGSFSAHGGGLDYGDSIVKLSLNSTGLALTDYFTPYDEGYLSSVDLDLGSGGAILPPDQPAGAAHQHLLLHAGKEGTVYLIDRDHMGGFGFTNNGQIIQSLNLAVGGMWAAPAWWNNRAYFGGSSDYMKMYTFDPYTGMLSSSPASVSPTFYGFPGPTPSVSANGNQDGIVWALQNDGYGNTSTVLHAYWAEDLSKELYNTQQNATRDDPGGAIKFSVPTIANGRVYVGTSTQVSVYGLLPR